ncbi:MAG: SMC-Scp complex subunit ScpB [Chthoniobacterales bacterium]
MTNDPPALKHIVEALVFASEKPVSAKEIGTVLRGAAAASPEDPLLAQFAKAKENELTDAIDELSADYVEANRAFEVRETATGWQLVSSPRFAPWLRQLFPESKPARLSAPALETLAIIAYRQPVTRADIEAVRGVAVDGVMQTILDRGLVRIAGRSELPGRPLLYETTTFFMEHFGLRNLDDLPNATELRQAAIAAAQESKPPPLEGEAPEIPADQSPEASGETPAESTSDRSDEFMDGTEPLSTDSHSSEESVTPQPSEADVFESLETETSDPEITDPESPLADSSPQ